MSFLPPFPGRDSSAQAPGCGKHREAVLQNPDGPPTPRCNQKSQLSTNTPHWPLDRLVPYEYTARTHSSVRLEQIANSIRHLRLHLYRPARHARSRRPEPHYRILTGRRPRPVMHKSQLSANTEHWPLDRLVPYEYNARTRSSAPLEQIANCIRQCGFTFTGRRATRTAEGVKVETLETPGGHEWANWRIYLHEAAPKLSHD